MSRCSRLWCPTVDDWAREPTEMYVPSLMPRDLVELATRPGVREPAEDLECEDRPLRLERGLADSYEASFPESGTGRRCRRASAGIWSSSLSDIPISSGTELVSDSDV